jgi:hypothetical protein
MQETQEQYFARMLLQLDRINNQNRLLEAALLKLDIMQLTPEQGMVELAVPEGISPARWKAMVTHAYKQGIPS